MLLKEVVSPADSRLFLDMVDVIYKNDSAYIRPLDKDISGTFDIKTNKLLKLGKAKRWIVLGETGCIGRIAAFHHPSASESMGLKVGGVGFFECINQQEVANLLLETAKLWLQSEGFEAMDGPINFGERDNFWGVLVDGFHPPLYKANYNPPYYASLFKNFGFDVFFEQYTYAREVNNDLNPAVIRKAERILATEGIYVKHVEKGNLASYAVPFAQVYNEAWVQHEAVGKMTKERAAAIMKAIKPIADEQLIWFAFHRDRPIGFFVMLPDINELVKHFNGKFGIFQKLKFLWMLKTGKIKKMLGVIFGVVPDYQRKGVEAAMVVGFSKLAADSSFKYRFMEMNWIGDFNPKMMRVAEQVGGNVYKTHQTLRFIFDLSVPFERMKIHH